MVTADQQPNTIYHRQSTLQTQAAHSSGILKPVYQSTQCLCPRRL